MNVSVERSLQIDRAHFKLHLNQQYHTPHRKMLMMLIGLMKSVTLQCIFTMECVTQQITKTMHTRFLRSKLHFFGEEICMSVNAFNVLNSGAKSKNHFIAMMCVKLEIQM